MSEAEITSEHTCARIEQILEELEALRLEMGRPKDARVPMHIRDASPREVYYHAQTVHRKANQLCVELGADSVSAPSAGRPAHAKPADVLRVLDSARERLARARAQLQLDGDSGQPKLPGPLLPLAGKEASDVLAGCLIASRQLNSMLAHAFASTEAHEQLTRAVGLAEHLLSFHRVELPKAPLLERRKFPRDVFEELWQCCEGLYEIMRTSGATALEINRGYVGEQPTDVYDLASLIVSELEYLSSLLPAKVSSALTMMPPPIVLPAHNFRRARQLRAAVTLLADAVRSQPDWARKSQI